MKTPKIILFASLLALSTCRPAIDTSGFDTRQWQEDPGGCAGKRKNLLADFKEFVKPVLKGKSDTQIRKVLGKPDYSELGKRGKKYFFYFLEKGPHCTGPAAPGKADCLRIRFEALNRANEIVVLIN